MREKDLAGHRDEFDQGGHDFITTITCESHAELGAEKAVGFADVEAETLDFAGEIAFASGDGVEAGSEGEFLG